jgi:chitinase
MLPAPATFASGTEDSKILKTLTGYTGYHSPITKGFYIFNGTTFWSYDDPTVIATKTDYINRLGLGGVMAWSLDNDDGTLENAIFQGLAHDHEG